MKSTCCRASFNALLKRLKSRHACEIFTGDHRSAEAAGDHFVALPTVSFKALDVEQIRHQLEHILTEEHIAHEPRALRSCVITCG